MIINFFIFSRPEPAGGVKTLYEYANGLVRRGHEVHIGHAYRRPEHRRGFESQTWFTFDPRITHHSGTEDDVRDHVGDIVFGPGLPRQFGLPVTTVQGLNTFAAEFERSTLLVGCPLICVSRWLADECVGHGVPAERVTVVPNGLDHDTFRVTRPPTDRPRRVAMLHHPHSVKGSHVGLEALERTRARCPDIEAIVFGTGDRPDELASWIEYRQSLDESQLVDEVFNEAQVFLCSSASEGFGNASLESMACGCALVSTSNGGVDEFATHDESALIAPPGDVAGLAAHLETALTDDGTRARLVEGGLRRASTFSWERTAEQLEAFLDAYRAEPSRYMSEWPTPIFEFDTPAS